MNNMHIDMPEGARMIIDTLKSAGYEAYIVGGCVRDAILGRVPGDWDITTSALPAEVKGLFRRTIDTGIQHGTVTVMVDKEGFEVTTYRIDGEYADGRHPDSVEFTKSLVEDLKRRDFTINAMAYNDDEGIIDEFDGMGDISRKVIRCVGNPVDRFTEDALRMMRAVRFSAQLSFDIEENTFNAIKELSGNISKISAERIQVELTKTIKSGHPEYIREYANAKLSQYIFPVIDRLLEGGEFENVVGSLANVSKEADVRYALLFMNEGEAQCVDALKALKFDNKTIDTAGKLVRHCNLLEKSDDVSVRSYLNVLDVDNLSKLIMCKRALAQSNGEDTGIFDEIRVAMNGIVDRGEAYKLSQLHMNGNKLMELGVAPGKMIGEVLGKLLDMVIVEPSCNTEERLSEEVRRWI